MDIDDTFMFLNRLLPCQKDLLTHTKFACSLMVMFTEILISLDLEKTLLKGLRIGLRYFNMYQKNISRQPTLGVQTFASRKFREAEKSRNLRH